MKSSVINAGREFFDRIFRALGDPHRMEIIELLREKELSAGEILEAVDVVQSTLSHHMKTLSDSGAVNAVRRGKWTYYSLNESNLSRAAAYLEECAKGTLVMKADSPLADAGNVKEKSPVRTDVVRLKQSEDRTAVESAEKIAAGDAGKPSAKDAGKPAGKDTGKPAAKDARKPSVKEWGKSAVKQTEKESERTSEKAGKKKDKKNKKNKKSKK